MLRPSTLICVCLLWSTVAVAEQTPLQYTHTLLNDFKRLKPDKGLTPAEKAENERIVDKLDHAFDFEGITTRLMAPKVSQFTPEQQKAFREKFHKLIRRGAFVDSGDFFKRGKLTFRPAQRKGDRTTVTVHVVDPTNDIDEDVGLVWRKVGGTLKVVDVLLDQDSEITDYQNQVSRIVDKKGVPGLLKALDDRLAKIERGEKIEASGKVEKAEE